MTLRPKAILVVLLLAACPQPQQPTPGLWQASGRDIGFHKGLRADERQRIYAATLAIAESLVNVSWGTPDGWAKLRGQPQTGARNRLCLDPALWTSLLATKPSALGMHDAQWSAQALPSPPFTGLCSTSPAGGLDPAVAPMEIQLSAISPGHAQTVVVHFVMSRAGFGCGWTITLSREPTGWAVEETRMQWIT